MIFYKEPFIFDDKIQNKDIKTIVEVFRNGNFNEARKRLVLIDTKNLNDMEIGEISKLKKMLYLDKAGLIAVLFLLVVIMSLFVSY